MFGACDGLNTTGECVRDLLSLFPQLVYPLDGPFVEAMSNMSSYLTASALTEEFASFFGLDCERDLGMPCREEFKEGRCVVQNHPQHCRG